MRPVRVLDGKEDDMPQCILTTASLDGHQLIAHCLTRGVVRESKQRRGVAAEQYCPIPCNGQSLLITQNLFDFLKELQRSRLRDAQVYENMSLSAGSTDLQTPQIGCLLGNDRKPF